MLRVFHPGPWPQAGSEIALSSGESAHLIKVRRARVGDAVAVLDGRGHVAECKLLNTDNTDARLRIEVHTHHLEPVAKVLVVGLPKGDVIMEIIRQATELGATAIVPLLTNRTEVNWDADRAQHKLDRWHAAALEACKQSGNFWLPKISAPVELTAWLKTLSAKKEDELRLVAALTPNAVPISKCYSASAPQPLCIAVGPEGDFSPEEYELFEKSDFTAVRLPGHVLRVETACVVALAVFG